MAKVYLATQNSLERAVAIKVLDNQSDEHYARRFIAEAHTVAAINHPGIVTIYDVSCLEDGRPYFVMECLEGGDLCQFKGLKLNPVKALGFVRQIAEGLSVIHDQKIVHRDIKPANILFRDVQSLVLSDFGIAKRLHSDSDLTQEGSSVGSPSYCSPEQSMDRILDPRSDLYSLGVVLLEMLVGNNLYVGGSVAETVVNHLQMEIPSLPFQLKAYQGIVDRLLAKAPSDRFQTAGELIVAIDNALGYSSSGSARETIWGKASKGCGSVLAAQIKRPWGLRLVVLLIIVSAGVWIALNFESEADSKVKVLLASAALAVEEARFESPESHNAQYFFEQVLFLKPRNQHALAGLKSLQGVQVEHYLSLAQVKVREKNWYLPESDNATFFYFKVLSLDPNNLAAKKGLSGLVDIYIESAQAAFASKEYRNAFTYLREGLLLDPRNEMLLSLKHKYLHQSNALKRFFNRVFK